MCVQKNANAGLTCGNGQVCDGNGTCASCAANTTCGSTCKPGTTSCSTGAQVCNQTNAAAGTGCGNNQVCDGGGNCVNKTSDGGSCQSNSQCQNGNCSKNSTTGASICCPSGATNCGSCVNESTDSSNCGACGKKCDPNNSCQNKVCVCNGRTLACGGCGSWGFDSGGAEGWTQGDLSEDIYGDNAVQNITASTSLKHDGTSSLAIPVNLDYGSTYYAEVAAPLCPNASSNTDYGTMNVAGSTITAWFFFAGPTMSFDYSNIAFWASGPDSATPLGVTFVNGTTQAIPTGTWVQYQGTFKTTFNAGYIGISIGTGSAWAGTWYIDSVTLTPP